MSFHLAAYVGETATPPTLQTPVLLPPAIDMYLPSTPTGFLLPSPMRIVAAWAASTDAGSASPAGLASATINAPSLLRVAYPSIRPLSHSVGESTDPNVMNLVAHPLLLPASENVGVLATVGAGATVGNKPIVALLWFCDELVPVPPGEIFTLRFATSSAPVGTPGVWSPMGTIVFDQTLPPGNYTVVGFEHWNRNAAAARLVFPGMHMRPGTLSMSGGSAFPSDQRTDRLFYEGGLGVYGTFSAYAPPSFEVIGGGGGSTLHEGYLSVIRTGDVGSPHERAPHAPR